MGENSVVKSGCGTQAEIDSIPVLLLTSCVIWDEYLTSLSLSVLIRRVGIYYYPLQWVAVSTPPSPQSAYMALSMYPATSTKSHFILLFFTEGNKPWEGRRRPV